MKHVNVPLQEDTHKRLRVYCALNGTNMADVIRELVVKFLDKVMTKTELLRAIKPAKDRAEKT